MWMAILLGTCHLPDLWLVTRRMPQIQGYVMGTDCLKYGPGSRAIPTLAIYHSVQILMKVTWN